VQVQNLAADATVRQQLLAAYRSARHNMSPEDITGPDKGSVYYALDNTTRTYWATATFSPSKRADPSAQAAFQEGENIGVFKRTDSGSWTASVHERSHFPCRGDVPASVLKAWGLAYDAGC
jgi:hypothetical protein